MKKSEKASYSYIKKQQYDELVNIRQYNLLDGYQILRVGEINPSTPKGGGRKIPHATLKTKIWNFSTPIIQYKLDINISFCSVFFMIINGYVYTLINILCVITDLLKTIYNTILSS